MDAISQRVIHVKWIMNFALHYQIAVTLRASERQVSQRTLVDGYIVAIIQHSEYGA